MAMSDARPGGPRLPVILAAMGTAASVANALILMKLVPEQAQGALGAGLALALGPALVLVALAAGRPRLGAAALAAFFVASVVTGFSVGFWNLVVAVPLCIAAVALEFSHRRRKGSPGGQPAP